MLTVVMLNIVLVGVVMLGIVTLSISIPNAARMLSVVILIVGASTPNIQATHTFQTYTALTNVEEMSVVEMTYINNIGNGTTHFLYSHLW